MNDYHQPLFPDNIYHLFSRAVGMEKLFLSHENFCFFAKTKTAHEQDMPAILLFADTQSFSSTGKNQR